METLRADIHSIGLNLIDRLVLLSSDLRHARRRTFAPVKFRGLTLPWREATIPPQLAFQRRGALS